jgi:energy-converting hydrogenase Eha subunit H
LGKIDFSGQILTIGIVNNTGITNFVKTPTDTFARIWATPIWGCTLLEENPH